jgi:ABC-type phosphate transport system substrate-binding protein
MTRILLLLACLGLAAPATAADEVVVIVNAANTATLTPKDIANLFLGKTSTFPDGKPARPLALQDGSPVRDEFNRKFLKKTPQQLDAYWASLIFTGRVTPPRQVATEAEARALVEANRDAIGFVRESVAGDKVRVLR